MVLGDGFPAGWVHHHLATPLSTSAPMKSRRPSRHETRKPPPLLRFNRLPLAVLGLCVLAWATSAHGQTTAKAQPSSSLAAYPCLMPAAQRHGVNPHILRAILQVESGMRPHVVNRNRNGSIDVGMAQINSIHFRELAQWGITPERLLDHCVATHVAAWHLKRVMLLHGNTWFGVAAYHSTTPVHNQRYQALLKQELVRSGVWR
jgi:soluble lytic murein transglycosylase-like protein